MTVTGGLRVADVLEVLDAWYPPERAEDWDVVGLAVGSRSAPVTAISYAVDPTVEVVAEARAAGSDLLITHHPPFLHGMRALDRDQPKGRLATEILESGMNLAVAHTNADVSPMGVVDALADRIGLTSRRALVPRPGPDPTGAASVDVGLGRIGPLAQPTRLGTLVEELADRLLRTARGLLLSGDPARSVQTVAVQAGAGDDLLDAARAGGAEVYLTSDLRHHPASEARAWPGAPALVDLPHWAAEQTWLPVVQRIVDDALGPRRVPSRVSELCTDPWTQRYG